MTNMPFDKIDDFRDVESVNYFRDAVTRRGEDETSVIAALRRKSRDNARTPVQWDASDHGGFTTGTPWMPANPNASWLNAAAQRHDRQSIYAYYRALVRLRHDDPIVADGDLEPIMPDHSQLWAFARNSAAGRLSVYTNLTDAAIEVSLDPRDEIAVLVLANRDDVIAADPLFAPWEARVLRS